jgi:ubiquinone/menaquinone biosynthesis C-methylase UbiE
MKKIISKKILDHHNKLFKEFHVSEKSLGYRTGQSIRFQVLSEIANLKNATVLDVGCGFGDLCRFLEKKKLNVKYYGVDINQDFIDVAKKRNPHGKFELRDIEKNPFNRKFDYVFGAGIFTLASFKNAKPIIKEQFRICKKGVAIDFVSTYVTYKDDFLFYTDPEKMFKFAKTLTKRVTLRHDYKPYEYCMYLHKNDKISNTNHFQEHFKSMPEPIQKDNWLKK